MSKINPKNFYLKQSPISAPGTFGPRLQELPDSIESLIDIVGGILIHFISDKEFINEKLIRLRKWEAELRFAESMLSRIFELAPEPLTVARNYEKRLLSTCRDAALLTCCLMRNKGIPARLRMGFAHFMYDKSKPIHDHVWVEYWDEATQRWQYCDARMSKEIKTRFNLHHINTVCIEEHSFETALEVWRNCRLGRRQACNYSPKKGTEDDGYSFIRCVMLYDLACLNRFEPLLWDAWGFMLVNPRGEAPRNQKELDLFDQIAAMDIRDDNDWLRAKKLYESHPGLRVLCPVHVYSPIKGYYQLNWKTKKFSDLPNSANAKFFSSRPVIKDLTKMHNEIYDQFCI